MKKKKEVIEITVRDKYIVTLNLSENLTLLVDEKYLNKVAKKVSKFIESDDHVLVFPYPATITKLDK